MKNIKNNSFSPINLQEQLEAKNTIISSLMIAIEQLKVKDEQQKITIEYLHEQVKKFRDMLFGQKTEKYGKRDITREDLTGTLFQFFSEEDLKELFNIRELPKDNIEEDSEIVDDKPNKRKKPGRRPIPENLTRVTIMLDIPEEEKICACGCQLQRIGEDISEKYEIIPARVVIERTERPKYACPCCEGTEDEGKTVKQMPAIKTIIPQCIVTSSTLSHIIVSKYCYSLPLYRQEMMFKQLGVDIPRTTMSSWILKTSTACKPLLDMFYRYLREGPIINMDETTVKVFREEDRDNKSTSYMWVARGGIKEKRVITFRYSPTRASTVPFDILGPTFKGYLQTDGYVGYNAIGESEGITHVGCLVHVRRKFHEILKHSNKPGVASTILNLIRKIYHHEKISKKNGDNILEMRQEKIKPILDKIKYILMTTHATPSSLLGKAVQYAKGQWSHIEAYLGHEDLTPDNNSAENAIRPFVIGRKNWLFIGSPNGAEASSTFYSLIETAKANKINPYEYLIYVFDNLPLAKTNEDLEALLPWNFNPPKKS